MKLRIIKKFPEESDLVLVDACIIETKYTKAEEKENGIKTEKIPFCHIICRNEEIAGIIEKEIGGSRIRTKKLAYDGVAAEELVRKLKTL